MLRRDDIPSGIGACRRASKVVVAHRHKHRCAQYASKVDHIVVLYHFGMALHIAIGAIEEKIVRPAAGSAVQISLLVAHSREEGDDGAHLGAKGGSDYAQGSTLTATGDKEIFAVELFHRSKVFGSSHTSQIHIVIVIGEAIINAHSRIVVQRIGANMAIVAIGLSERQSMDAHIEGNHAVHGGLDVIIPSSAGDK